MAEAVVAAGLERIGELLIWEGKFLSGVTNQVHDLQSQLEKLQSFLKDADRKRGGEDVFSWVQEVREVALKTEDALESYIVDVESRRKYGLLEQFGCCDIFGECITLNNFNMEIKSIQHKLIRLAERKEYLDIVELGESSNAEQDIQVLSDAHLMEPDFVGREREIEELVSHLKHETRVRQVVSICGMGGVGKTALARRVYNDVRPYFHASVWVSVSENFKHHKVLQDILENLVPDWKPEDFTAMEIEQLQETIHKVLTEKKCLVVLDDIWSKSQWRILELAFPYGEEDSGTKILLTTRNKEVAYLAFTYQIEGLTVDEGWDLLREKAFPHNRHYDPYAEDRIDPEKEAIGREIVKKCQGLPLAICLLGGVLRGKRSLNDWRLFNYDISSTDAYTNVLGMLGRSYDDLDFRHKQLFLYLGNYGESEEIDTELLYQRWIAEGMVSSGVRQAKGEILMDVAESYLIELAERSLVQVTPAPYGGWIKFRSCRLHVLTRDLCLMKRKEEDILNLTAIRDTPSESFVSQAPYGELSTLAKYVYNGFDSRVPLEKQEFEQLRSLAFVGHQELPQIVQNLLQFKLLRVLNLDEFVFKQGKLPQELSYLIHLRYLSLFRCTLTELPPFIGDFMYMETLDLRVETENFMIPNVLWKLRRLKHLYLPLNYVCITTTSGKLNFDGLDELEMLVNFPASKCHIDDLVHLARLQVIENVQVESAQQLEDALKVIASTRRYTSLNVEHVDLMSSEPSGLGISSNYLTQLLECAGLHYLIISSDVGGSFRKEFNHRIFSPSLAEIQLVDCEYEDDPMPLLEMLPNLRRLLIGYDSYLGNEIICSAIGFPRLTHLSLVGLRNLKVLSLEEGTMPKLSELRICKCRELVMLPDGLRFLMFLREITILEMSEEFNDRIIEANGGPGVDFYKVCHIPHISVNTIQIHH